jgi:hypothetical protein
MYAEGREVRMATHMGRLEARRGASNPFLSWHAFGIDQLFPAHSAQEAASAGTRRWKVSLVEPTTKLTAFCQARRWANSPRFDKSPVLRGGECMGVVAVTIFVLLMVSIKSCYHLNNAIRLRDSSATMPPVGASFGQSRHLSQWRSSVTNSTPAIRPTHQVRQSTIEEGSQNNEVYSSSSNFSSDKPSGICDEGANASSLLIFFRNTPTGIPNPIY